MSSTLDEARRMLVRGVRRYGDATNYARAAGLQPSTVLALQKENAFEPRQATMKKLAAALDENWPSVPTALGKNDVERVEDPASSGVWPLVANKINSQYEVWRVLKNSMDLLGYMPGDFLVVVYPHKMTVAQKVIIAHDKTQDRVVLRQLEPPYLVSRTTERVADAPIGPGQYDVVGGVLGMWRGGPF